MRKFSIFFCIVCSMLWNFQLISQESSLAYDYNLGLPNSSGLHDLVLFSEGVLSAVDVNPQLNGNQIFIQQIGDTNNFQSSVSSQNSKLEILQTGNNNYASLEMVVNSIEGSIIQSGNTNFLWTSAYDPSQDFSINVNMTGNGHHLESYGANSIGNKLSIEMTGESQALIVRNFN